MVPERFFYKRLWYCIEDVEESICERSVSESFEAKGLQNRESLIEFIFIKDAVLRTVPKRFFYYL